MPSRARLAESRMLEHAEDGLREPPTPNGSRSTFELPEPDLLSSTPAARDDRGVFRNLEPSRGVARQWLRRDQARTVRARARSSARRGSLTPDATDASAAALLNVATFFFSACRLPPFAP